MRISQILLVTMAMFGATQSFAHGAGPCETYRTACKSDATVTAATGKAKWGAMKECVTKAATADAANGQKCLDFQAKLKPPGGPAGAAPAAAPDASKE